MNYDKLSIKHIPEWIEFKQLQSIHFLFPCPFTFIFCFNCIKLISYDTFHCPYRRSLFNIDIIHSAENGKSIFAGSIKDVICRQLDIPFFR